LGNAAIDLQIWKREKRWRQRLQKSPARPALICFHHRDTQSDNLYSYINILVTPGGASSSIPKVTQLSHFYADELFRCVFVD